MKTMEIEPGCGTHISFACEEAVRMSRRHHCRVEFTFNGIRIYATPKRCAASLEWDWTIANDREVWKYRNSDEGRRIAKRRRDNIVSTQAVIDQLMDGIDEALGNGLTGTMFWLRKFAHHADLTGLEYSLEFVIGKLEAAGYQRNAHVGRKESDFEDPQLCGEYICGQAIDVMYHGMSPHPMTVDFVNKYLALIGKANQPK